MSEPAAPFDQAADCGQDAHRHLRPLFYICEDCGRIEANDNLPDAQRHRVVRRAEDEALGRGLSALAAAIHESAAQAIGTIDAWTAAHD